MALDITAFTAPFRGPTHTWQLPPPDIGVDPTLPGVDFSVHGTNGPSCEIGDI
ncbi:MAG: hypothetical protein JNK78_19500 [Planctomycetes bacterium]|nr:hypothetical protein [Planctomycetota bacterium]